MLVPLTIGHSPFPDIPLVTLNLEASSDHQSPISSAQCTSELPQPPGVGLNQ